MLTQKLNIPLDWAARPSGIDPLVDPEGYNEEQAHNTEVRLNQLFGDAEELPEESLPPRSRLVVCTHAKAPHRLVLEQVILLERQLQQARPFLHGRIRDEWRQRQGLLEPREPLSQRLPPVPAPLPGNEDPAASRAYHEFTRLIYARITEVSQGKLSLDPVTWMTRGEDYSAHLYGQVLEAIQAHSDGAKPFCEELWLQVLEDLRTIERGSLQELRLQSYVVELARVRSLHREEYGLGDRIPAWKQKSLAECLAVRDFEAHKIGPERFREITGETPEAYYGKLDQETFGHMLQRANEVKGE